MNVLITGGSGRLGQDLIRVFEPSHSVAAPSHQQVDLTQSSALDAFFTSQHPDLVLHSAAVADADVCERDPHLAYRVNTLATQNLALACARHKALLVFISTDYVFDGQKGSPYHEFDPVHPINVYGNSKLAAEQLVQTNLERFFIIRTAWLFGESGQNFLTGVLQSACTGKPVKAAFDQAGCPTSTLDLSQAILALVQTPFYGIYHIVNEGGMTWYEYARLILDAAGKDTFIEPIRKEQRGPAPRPANTILENMCLNLRRIYHMPTAEEAVRACVYGLTQPGGRFA